MPTVIPPISLLGKAPQRSDPVNFADDGDKFLGKLPAFGEELNDFGDAVNQIAGEVSANAVDAQASADAAVSATNCGPWVSGSNYSSGTTKYSLIDFQSYRRKLDGISSTDPSLDIAGWVQLSTVPKQTGNSGKFLTTDGNSAAWATLPSVPDFILFNLGVI